jgi:CHAT domain-containing protein/Flp pilus assembly protein TadD
MNMVRTFRLKAIGGLMLAVAGVSQSVPATGWSAISPAQTPVALESGKPYHGELKEGATATFSVRLEKDSFFELKVTPKGFDIAVGADGPDGKTVIENDFERSRSGPESLAFIAAVAGEYRIRLFGKRPDAGRGNYDISGVTIRPATENDRLTARAETLFAESWALFDKRKYEPAVAPAREGIALYEKAYGGDDSRLVLRLTYLGGLLLALADFPKAEAEFSRALALSEKGIGPETWQTAWIHNQLGVLYKTKGDYPKAETAYQKARELFGKLAAPDQLDYAESLNNLGVLYRVTGDYSRARPLYEQAAAIKEKQLPPDHQDIGLGLNNLGLLYLSQGDYWNAEKALLRVVPIYEKRLGPESPEVAAALNNLALLYKSMGNYAKAEPLYARSLAIKEKQWGPVHTDVAIALNNLGLLYQSERKYDEAEVALLRAAQIREKLLGPENPDLATTLYNLGFTYEKKRELDKADAMYQRARAIFEKQLPADHPHVANCFNRLGGLALSRQRYAEAGPLLLRALASRKAVLGAGHPDFADSLFSLSRLARLSGDIPKAVAYADEGNVVMEQDFLRNLVGGSEQQKVLYLKRSETFVDMVISLNLDAAPENPAAAGAALTAVLQRKGRALDMMSRGIDALRERSNSEDRALLDSLAAAQTRLANLSLRMPGPKDLQKYRDQIAALEKEVGEIQARISARSGELRVQTQPVTLDAVRRVVPEDAALVEFSAYLPFDAKANAFGKPRYAAFVLARDGNPKGIDLGETAVIHAAIEKFRRGFTLADAEAGRDARPAGRELDRLIMEPVRKILGDRTNLLLSPDGVLNLVPFSALVDEQNRFLVERFRMTYLSSGRDLLRLQTRSESKGAPMVFADPDFGKDSKTALPGFLAGVPISRLPETAAEADSIRRFFPDSKILRGAAATETAIKAARHPRFLHIATHGFFFQEEEETPTGANGTRNLTHGPENDELTWLRVNNPLVQSGLVLAGVRQPSANRPDDGVFTALEAAGLDLSGTELVVLSACDSGVGEIRTGDGVYGLRRALVMAGSESQLMSLWPVSDRGTRELMTEYYRRLKSGEGRAAALRSVQLSMLKNPRRTHPYFWASFIQSGDWNPLKQ